MRRRRRRKHGPCEGGYTFIEVAVSGAILALGLLSQASLTVSNVGQTAANRESRIALDAAHNKIEDLKAHDFQSTFRDYDNSAEAHFHVQGLTPADGDNDRIVGRVIFPTAPDTVTGVRVLREDVHDDALGMPRDLDGDGAIDAHAKDDTYRILPVLVEIRWRGKLGDRVFRVASLLQRGGE